MALALGKRVDLTQAISWVRRSLSQGGEASQVVAERLGAMAHAILLVSPARVSVELGELDDSGRGLPGAEADEVAARLFGLVAMRGSATLVIEDDMRRRGDPHGGRAAFVGNRLLHWQTLTEDGVAAVRFLRTNSSGYPLNAFVVAGTSAELRFAPACELTGHDLKRLAASTLVVVASVWDNEALVAVTTFEP